MPGLHQCIFKDSSTFQSSKNLHRSPENCTISPMFTPCLSQKPSVYAVFNINLFNPLNELYAFTHNTWCLENEKTMEFISGIEPHFLWMTLIKHFLSPALRGTWLNKPSTTRIPPPGPPVVVEPVDDGAGLQVELGGQLLNGLGGGVGLLLVGFLQSLLLLWAQHHSRLLQLLPRALGTLDVIRPHQARVHGVAVAQGAQSPLHVSCKHKARHVEGWRVSKWKRQCRTSQLLQCYSTILSSSTMAPSM